MKNIYKPKLTEILKITQVFQDTKYINSSMAIQNINSQRINRKTIFSFYLPSKNLRIIKKTHQGDANKNASNRQMIFPIEAFTLIAFQHLIHTTPLPSIFPLPSVFAKSAQINTTPLPQIHPWGSDSNSCFIANIAGISKAIKAV